VIALAGLLVLVAVALLVGGLSGGDTVLLWSSVGVSGLAAVVLTVQTVRRNRATAAKVAAAKGAAAPEPVVPGKPVAVAEQPPVVEEPVVAAETPGAVEPVVGKRASRPAATRATPSDGEPAEEEVEVTDLLLVIDLTDEVVVVDEHPRYHLAGCSQTAGAEEIPLPLVEARQDGFTACGVCCPDQHLAAAERSRRAAAKSQTA